MWKRVKPIDRIQDSLDHCGRILWGIDADLIEDAAEIAECAG